MKINNAYKVTKRNDIQLDKMRNQIMRNFDNTLLASDVVVNGIKKKLLIMSHSKKDMRKVAANPIDDPVKPGDLVEWKDSYWLVTETNPNENVISQGVMERCNQQLKWVDENGDIQIQPTVFYFNSRSSFGVEEGKVMPLPDGRRQIVVQLNSHTKKLRRDKRFLFGDEAFRVIDYDFVSDEGLVNLSLQSDSYNPATDNLELGIADYHEKVAEYHIEIANQSFSTINLNQTLQVQASVKNHDKLIENPILTYSVDNNRIADISSNGLLTPKEAGTVTVSINYKNALAQTLVSITETKSSNYTVVINGDDSVTANRTKKYSCEFFKNGEVYVDESQFYVTAEDGVLPSKLASIITQDSVTNTCEVKANKELGSFILHVKNMNGLSITSKKIKVKSLL